MSMHSRARCVRARGVSSVLPSRRWHGVNVAIFRCTFSPRRNECLSVRARDACDRRRRDVCVTRHAVVVVVVVVSRRPHVAPTLASDASSAPPSPPSPSRADGAPAFTPRTLAPLPPALPHVRALVENALATTTSTLAPVSARIDGKITGFGTATLPRNGPCALECPCTVALDAFARVACRPCSRRGGGMALMSRFFGALFRQGEMNVFPSVRVTRAIVAAATCA
mmetsp:Transcript_3023/g.6509  ORF Transcript_3023/g.6509 Transcript_3023/m.6509 type:complete len:225 (+) Transcript_3023:297-971(+)